MYFFMSEKMFCLRGEGTKREDTPGLVRGLAPADKGADAGGADAHNRLVISAHSLPLNTI